MLKILSVSLAGTVHNAGGEIGPEAKAGRESAFQAVKTALQGFTAIFASFIVQLST
jgi:hypothetical protein